MVELTLYQGDCLEIMKELPAQSVDLIICDLPYGCLAGGGGGNSLDADIGHKKPSMVDLRTGLPRGRLGGKTQSLNSYRNGCQWDVKINLEEFWKEVKRIRKNEHTPCIHFCTTKFGNELINSNPTEFRYDLVWNKENGVSFLSANKMPMRSHEMIYVFSKAGAFYQRIDEIGDFKQWNRPPNVNKGGCYGNVVKPISEGGDGTRCALSVINMKKNRKKYNIHPTEKLNDLYKWLIERYCPAGGTVLDPTFGSGNSVFTAYTMGRNAIGIEMDDTFFEKAVERLNAL
jgi:site-specific DNA-methyltransferase (adenine-specific)